MGQMKVQNMDDVVLLIPAFNEGSVIKNTIKNIPKQFKNIICIDDGSTDDTARHILDTRAQIVRHVVNLGQGAALQTGIEFALCDERYKYFVTYDADGQHNIHDVVRMIEVIKKDDYDIVLGSRFLGEALNIRPFKKHMLKYAVLFSNYSSGIRLTDTHNGLRVFTRRTAELLNLEMPDFAHASEIIHRIADYKLRYMEMPVTISYTEYSKAKGQSMINAVNIFFDVALRKILKK